MLSLLYIENIAVIERAEIVFGEGLNVLTGETGAGKSIVIDALGAVAGLRTSRELVRAEASAARVSAVFMRVPAPARAMLEENGFGLAEGEELLVQRDISADGRNLCRVNGRPATVSFLRQLGEYLIQIHGQHDSQALLGEENHRALLDRFAGLEDRLLAYREAYTHWKELEKQRAALHMGEVEKARRVEELQYCCEEIEAAGLTPGEEEELLQRRRVLQNAGRVREALETAAALLRGDDETEGGLSQLSEAVRALQGIAALSVEFTALHEKFTELSYLAEDAAAELDIRRYAAEDAPGELSAIEERLDILYRLKRKYGASEEEVLAYGARCRDELDGLIFAEQKLSQLEGECASARGGTEALAAELTGARRAAAEEMAGRVVSELHGLDMGRVDFAAEVSARDGAEALREHGRNDVRFLLSANPGQPLKSLSRVASGGELSRVMLALKNVLSEGDEIGTQVFDEIDAGVSGRAAGRVAERLSALARKRQVLCVTHLPQIAAMADTQLRIEKEVSGGRTLTNVDSLGYAGRVDELARLIGGLNITGITRESAAEQLAAAEAYKKGRQV